MTKSRHSATRLRLSSLFRWLAMLCFIKLCLVAMLMLDLPLPGWLGGDSTLSENPLVSQQPEHQPEYQVNQQIEQLALKPSSPAAGPESPEGQLQVTQHPSVSSVLAAIDRIDATHRDAAPEPQGAAAARLAATTKPQPQTPPVAAVPPLTTPLLRAGVTSKPKPEEGLLNMLGLTRLPIPALGSVQTAHAAAQDMPVPSVPLGGGSPFAPAEQVSPLRGAAGSASVSPEVPVVPALPGIMTAQATNIPQDNNFPGLPRSRDITSPAPAPNITPNSPPGDPNFKAQELARQQQDILMLRQQMDQRLRELEEAERKMKDMISQARELEDRKVRNLIQMYANMKPRMAAKALESMDERVAVRILSGMAPKQSGEILTYTNPSKTAKFTELITRMRMPD